MRAAAVLTFLSAIIFTVNGCVHPSDQLFNIHIVNFQTNFRFQRHENFQNSTLHIIYQWNISKLPRTKFDGYFYKVIDRDLQSFEKADGSYDGFFKSEYDADSCVGLDGKLWALDKNSTARLCTIPCQEYLPTICNHSLVCNLNRLNYSVLPPNATKLEVPIKFGRVYDFNLVYYKNWHIGRSSILEGGQSVAYCKHELVFNQNLSHVDAQNFCRDKMQYADSAKSSGPATHFERLNTTFNLTTNRASMTFRWRAPYDSAPNMWLAGFYVYIKRDSGPSYTMKVKTSNETERTGFYTIVVDEIEMHQRNWIMIIPKLDVTTNCSGICHHYGISLREYFNIADIDACNSTNGVGRYCAENAKCIDMPGSSTISANCTCHDGFSGNGISTSWDGGTGCYAYHRACLSDDETGICDVVATCINAVCQCPNLYIGDGYRSGTGCSNRNLVIGLGVSIPLLVILVIGLGWYIWKEKKFKHRSIRLGDEDL